MENVVYLLGAGFSAPLGLPVMSNFLERANDLYQSNEVDYAHFKRVFQNIKAKLAYVALFYHADLTNIEEVLSILEMERLVGNVTKSETDEFTRLILDVIEYYTPTFEGLKNLQRKSKGTYQAQEKLFNHQVREALILGDAQKIYGDFVLSLFHVEKEIVGIADQISNAPHNRQEQFQEFQVKCKSIEAPLANYSIVTLNYDLVLEKIAEYYSSVILEDELKFVRRGEAKREGFPSLAKLHGSLDDRTIIPPTWNKSLHEKIEAEWKLAYKLLSSANHVRILGYSLPDSDAYVKYLLKSSLLEAENFNFKTIDVICMDSKNEVKNRYDSFISLKSPKYRFVNGDLKNYLTWVAGTFGPEKGHQEFIKQQMNAERGVI